MCEENINPSFIEIMRPLIHECNLLWIRIQQLILEDRKRENNIPKALKQNPITPKEIDNWQLRSKSFIQTKAEKVVKEFTIGEQTKIHIYTILKNNKVIGYITENEKESWDKSEEEFLKNFLNKENKI